jgi:hypothetical protein
VEVLIGIRRWARVAKSTIREGSRDRVDTGGKVGCFDSIVADPERNQRGRGKSNEEIELR